MTLKNVKRPPSKESTCHVESPGNEIKLINAGCLSSKLYVRFKQTVFCEFTLSPGKQNRGPCIQNVDLVT